MRPPTHPPTHPPTQVPNNDFVLTTHRTRPRLFRLHHIPPTHPPHPHSLPPTQVPNNDFVLTTRELGRASSASTTSTYSPTHPPTHSPTQVPNNDFVLTTRELGRLFRLHHIHLPTLPGQPPDDPLGESTGAAVLFGATGGVMEGKSPTHPPTYLSYLQHLNQPPFLHPWGLATQSAHLLLLLLLHPPTFLPSAALQTAYELASTHPPSPP